MKQGAVQEERDGGEAAAGQFAGVGEGECERASRE